MRGLIDAIVRYLPSPIEQGAVAATDAKSGAAVDPRRTRPGRSSCALPHDARTRTSAGSRSSASSPARSRARAMRGTRPATRTSGSASCSSCTARSRSPSASSRPARSGPSPSSRSRYRRHAVHARSARSSSPRSSSPRRRSSLPSSPDEGRPGQDGPGAPAHARGGAHRAGRAQRRRRAAARRDGRDARRRPRRAAQAQVRVAVVTHAPKIAYRETIRGKTQCTAGTRSRPAGTACSATCGWSSSPTPAGGVEFAERVVGGLVPQQLLPRRREGHPGGRRRGRPRRLPARDFKATLYDGSLPPGRLERPLLPDRRVHGPQAGRPRSAAGPHRADHGGRGSGAGALTWAT